MKGLREPKPTFMPKLEPWPSKRDGRRYLDGCRRMVERLAVAIAAREAREYEAAVSAWESEGGR